MLCFGLFQRGTASVASGGGEACSREVRAVSLLEEGGRLSRTWLVDAAAGLRGGMTA